MVVAIVAVIVTQLSMITQCCTTSSAPLFTSVYIFYMVNKQPLTKLDDSHDTRNHEGNRKTG